MDAGTNIETATNLGRLNSAVPCSLRDFIRQLNERLQPPLVL
jgi:hypothetical protein